MVHNVLFTQQDKESQPVFINC